MRLELSVLMEIAWACRLAGARRGPGTGVEFVSYMVFCGAKCLVLEKIFGVSGGQI